MPQSSHFLGMKTTIDLSACLPRKSHLAVGKSDCIRAAYSNYQWPAVALSSLINGLQSLYLGVLLFIYLTEVTLYWFCCSPPVVPWSSGLKPGRMRSKRRKTRHARHQTK